MVKLEETTRWRDVSGGNIQKVSSDITIANSVPFSMNLLFDKVLGEAVSRKGTGLISTPEAGKTCLGLYNHIDSTPANSKLFSAFNGSVYGATTLTGLNSSAKCRFTTFLNTTLMLNGVQARSYDSVNGWLSTEGALDVDNVPSGGKFPVEFKDRMYCAVADKIYYSSTTASGWLTGVTYKVGRLIRNGTSFYNCIVEHTSGVFATDLAANKWEAVNNQITWINEGSGSLQAEQEDGGGLIQGLNKVPGYLMIYKQRSLKRWNFDSSFPEDLVNIGTNSNESVVRARGKNYFFFNGNIYETNGGYPTKISRPIQRIMEGISSSFYGDVNGWSDNEDIYWSVGDVTVDFDRGFTETYTNVVIKYNIDSQQWAPFRYAHEFRFLTQYISGDDTLIIGGDSAGQVLQLNTNNTDYGGSAITYILQSPEFDFKFRELRKTISDTIYVHSDGQGGNLMVRLDYGEWKSIGSIKDIVTPVQIKSLTAKVFEFRICDSISGEQIKLRGLDFVNVNILEN